jgi:hypothetical protein
MPVVNTNSDLATAQAAAASSYPTSELDAFGSIIYTQVKVTVPASGTSPLLNANDTLTLLPASLCPVGAYLVPKLSSVYCVTDPGTALTLDIGTPDDPDKFADALALTTAGTTGGAVNFSASGTAPAAIATPYKFTSQEAIIATAVTVSSVSETVVVFTLAFRVKA